MEIEVREQEKLAMFWLTRAEQEDNLLREQIKKDAALYRQQKYTVAVFCSGKGALVDSAQGLLLHNQKALARRDLAQAEEAAAGLFMSM